MKQSLILVVLSACLAIAGCKSEPQKLNDLCSRVLDISKMTNDCDKMADALTPATADYKQILNKLGESVPDETTRMQITDANSGCTRGYLEIATGVCGQNPRIKALTNFEQ